MLHMLLKAVPCRVVSRLLFGYVVLLAAVVGSSIQLLEGCVVGGTSHHCMLHRIIGSSTSEPQNK